MATRVKLFYDTSICIDASRGRIPANEWIRVNRFVYSTFRYCISILTLDELLCGIHKGDPAQFLRNRRALELLFPAHRKTFLPYPGDFIAAYVFGQRRSPPDQTKMNALVKAFLKSKSANDLGAKPIWKGKHDTALSELLWTSNWYSQVQFNYARDYSSARKENEEDFPEELWAKMLLEHLKQPDTPANRQLAANSLNAQFLLSRFFLQAKSDDRYDFFRHSSDLVDLQQLSYLVDPNIVFVSNDRKLKAHIRASPQSSRVWTWETLKSRSLERSGSSRQPGNLNTQTPSPAPA